ncbi:unnamed protein product [Lactuca virosa]|uniref:Uncharacterized protein n=1 Tax=Lactuca virosa TaxID=75947 RepID=A0AAU9N1C2_9ASTR|nr:unnamed protein product [Lactuca virosa]
MAKPLPSATLPTPAACSASPPPSPDFQPLRLEGMSDKGGDGYVKPRHGHYNVIRKISSNLIVIGKTSIEIEKEDVNNDADDADNAEESEGDEFEQETG